MSEVDEGSHLSKRRRVARACDQCRHGKLRCDGGSPRCSKCVETKKACSYCASAKRRGLKTGYVRALECLWGLVLQRISGSEAAVESLLSTASVQDFRVRDTPGDGTSGAESLLASWKASKIPEKIHRLLAATEDSEDDTNSIPNATTRDVELQHPVISWDAHVQRPSEQTSPRSTEKDLAEGLQAAQSGDIGHTAIGSNITSAVPGQPALPNSLSLPAGSRRLLDRYFSYTHSWLPILERHVVFQTLYSYPTQGSIITRQSPNSGEHAVLWAILACASAEAPLSEITPPQIARSTYASEIMYAYARNLIPWENEREYSLGHVQALTILALYRWVIHDYTASWLAISHAISIATTIGIDQLSTVWQHQKCSAGRVWLGCFVMESLLAMRLRREPHLKPEDVDLYLPIDESGPEEWEPWQPYCSYLDPLHHQDAEPILPMRTLSTFNQLVRLICIANSFLRKSPGTSRMQQVALLQGWTETLPKHCTQFCFRSGSNTATLILSPNTVNLGFVYLCLEVQLCVESTRGEDGVHAYGVYGDLINQLCKPGKSQILPPSLGILANVASDTPDPPIQSQEKTLRQLQQNLSRLGLGSSSEKWKLASINNGGLHLHDKSWPPVSINIDGGRREPSVNSGTSGAADANCVFQLEAATDHDTLSSIRKSNGHEFASFLQTDSNISARDVAISAGPSRTRESENVMNHTNPTYRSLLSPLDATQGSYALTLQQNLAQQARTNDVASLGRAQPVDIPAACPADFLNPETLPPMAEGESFLDYFELFDDLGIQNQSRFKKALGYSI